MLIVKTIKELQNYQSKQSYLNSNVGFVPTMGALHQGHLSLVEKSMRDNDITVVSIFVNPTQFNEDDDYNNYPRTEDADINLLKALSPEVVFMPSADEMYKDSDPAIHIELNGLDRVMEGNFREGHFHGVITIVNKLFKLVQPNRAYFGLKDFQQLTIIKHFAKEYYPDLQIVPCPIIREADGLAMSSRNRRLSNQDREVSLLLSQVLYFLKKHWKVTPFNDLLAQAKAMFSNSEANLEYLEVVDVESLLPQSEYSESPLVACVAARVGKVRLIDNILLP